MSRLARYLELEAMASHLEESTSVKLFPIWEELDKLWIELSPFERKMLNERDESRPS
jgi:hypothetical protein